MNNRAVTLVEHAPSGRPERSAGQRAWDICGRARRMHELDLDLLLLALQHATAIGAAAVAANAPTDHRSAPIRAARLFAALQVKLSLDPPQAAGLSRMEALLSTLPDRWASTLRDRLKAARSAALPARPQPGGMRR